uniref:Photosystem I assembly protein Ycf4 n=3 Tax=Cuscuta subgen. Grammica TaxID=1824618 RepID=YCF4_CUSGR|nr:photosystem I assembly protein Ycf4 [Cuscuta gronovii]YP_009996228.1 photosystem I assembly protein Ycf4 [Cuscuta campestris]A7M908.1 RecName: Full=Photosystem I assembly protein Ycf4 [Cuscuta gronovii]QNQ65355.1 photosystem I assembly protein Ycf4 [Cuscuta campestris]QPJ79472.1 photosystem I assembly protein Ycf4 [Cuscuta gronovii]WCF05527.1 photosystem I assembly protein Ycf4 [Cuscuta gronovii]WNN67032.1 photosystem I assembly protein ycf4 [Cuscuta gronovii]CAM98336.1 PSI assembly prote
MSWRSEQIWIELIPGSRRGSNFVWAFILFFGSLEFILVGTASYFSQNLIAFFPQGMVMIFYGISGLFISLYLSSMLFWNVGGGYNQFDKTRGVICIFRWVFPGRNRRLLLRFFMKDIRSIRIEVKEGFYTRRLLYMDIRGQKAIPLTRTDEVLTPVEIEKKAAELASFLCVPIEVL